MPGPTHVVSGTFAVDAFYASGSGSGPLLTFPKPALAEVGDIILAQITGYPSGGGASAIPTAPADWTSLATYSGGHGVRVAAKVIEEGETSWEFTGTSIYLGLVYSVWRGADPSASGLVVGSGRYASSGTTRTIPGITTTRANSVAVNLRQTEVNDSAQPSGFTETVDQSVALGFGGPASHGVASYKAFAAAGATGSPTYTALPFERTYDILIGVQPPPPPTVTSVVPGAGGITGGGTVTIAGTGFTADSTVSIGGTPATEVEFISTTELRCVVPAHAAGAVDVVVTNEGGDGTLDDGYTYTSVVDADVRLIKAGSPSGDDKASADEWPAISGWSVYGGTNDLWGTTWTAAQVNTDFGAAIAAVVGADAQAYVDAVRVTVFYTVPGITDPQTYVTYLHVDPDRETYRSVIRQLPRSGYTVLTDPAIDRRVSGASLFSSRIDEPGRNIEKLWFAWEQTVELDPEGLTAAGVQVWARVDDGNAFQLLDENGSGKTVRVSGYHRFFFPPTDVARGKYIQLEWRVPELTGSLEPVAIALSAGVLRAYYRPQNAEESGMTLILHKYTKQEAYEERRTPYKRLEALLALRDPGRPPIEIRDAFGRTQRVVVTNVRARELTFRGDDTPSLVAFIDYDVVDYA